MPSTGACIFLLKTVLPKVKDFKLAHFSSVYCCVIIFSQVFTDLIPLLLNMNLNGACMINCTASYSVVNFRANSSERMAVL